MEATKLIRGSVLWWDEHKVWGFAKEDGTDQDYFLHISNFENCRILSTGDVITFTAGKRNGRPIAKNINKIE